MNEVATMLAEERRKYLIDLIQQHGQIVTSEVATQLNVTDVTIRTDLDELERRGRLTRTRGGAVAVDHHEPIVGFGARLPLHKEAKNRIALAAARFVGSDQTIILDSGTTALQLAQVLPEVEGLNVVTPNIAIAQRLQKVDGVETHLLGGRVDPDWFCTVGTPREQGIKDLVAHTFFLGARGIDNDFDLVDQSHTLAKNKRQLARRARRVILIVDSSKWQTPGPMKIMPIDRIDVVITDAGIPDEVRGHLESKDLELILVDD